MVPTEPLRLEPDRSQVGSLVQMWARYMIETRGKDREMAKWEFNMADAFDPNLTYQFVQALNASNDDRVAAAKEYLATFQSLKADLNTAIFAMQRQAPTDLLYLDRLNVMDLEIQAVIAMADQQPDVALVHAREASRLEGEMPFAFGPPFIDWPSAEMLGGLLLTNGQYDEAVEAYETQAGRTRLKTLPMLGQARAEEARGNTTTADQLRARLASVWVNADEDVKAKLQSD